MKKMLKRADGSKSRRGLWDNIRAKAASNKKAGKKGKAPSDAMLEQENKIKAEERKMGGNWMQDSKELKFGGPSKPKKYQTGQAAEEDIQLPTTPVKYTLSPAKVELSGESRGGRTAGSGKSFGQKNICVGAGCKEVIAAGSSDSGYQGKGAQGLSMKPKIDRSRIVEQTADEKLAGLENQAKYKAEAEARMAKKKAEREARAAASAPAEVQYDYKKVYAIDPNAPFDPNAKQKTGGKRKYIKK